MIDEMLEQEPLNYSHVEQLSPHSDRYIIPRDQSWCKMHALILSNTT